MRLYLVQHGDAVPERLDPERSLSVAGRQEVEAVARLLAGAHARVAHVVHSGKLRAQQTAELLATALAPGTVPQAMAGLRPNDPVEPTVRTITDRTSDMMLVGHLPSMGKLVACLVAGDEHKPVAAFVPGTVVCLQQDEAGGWVIAWMVRPELALASVSDPALPD